MSAENGSSRPELEPLSVWFPLRESASNEFGFTQVGGVAWFPSQMPSHFEISPAKLEEIISKLGYSCVVIRSFSAEQEKPTISFSGAGRDGTTTIINARVTEVKKTSHERGNDTLYLDFDFSEILAEARASAGYYQLSHAQQKAVQSKHINDAFKRELSQVAREQAVMETAKEALTYSWIMAMIANNFVTEKLLQHLRTDAGLPDSDEVVSVPVILFLISHALGYAFVRYGQALTEAMKHTGKQNGFFDTLDKAHQELFRNPSLYVHILPQVQNSVRPLIQLRNISRLSQENLIRHSRE